MSKRVSIRSVFKLGNSYVTTLHPQFVRKNNLETDGNIRMISNDEFVLIAPIRENQKLENLFKNLKKNQKVEEENLSGE